MYRNLKILCRRIDHPASFNICRFFLSQPYYCEDVWQQRLSDPLVKDIKPVDFYYELLQKFRKDGKVSAIDSDLFINRIQHDGKDELLEEMDEILMLLRRSTETVKTLPSTPHAFIRHLIKLNQTNTILKVLADTTNYGIFSCHYLSNLLMDHFIEAKEYTGAARVAFSLVLQEDFGNSLNKHLVLYSCFKYAFNDAENSPWVDYTVVKEPEEEIKIRVDYLRNPYFDDHFDIKNPLHAVGKTLAWTADHLENGPIRSNAEVLGWALYQKFDKLKLSLENIAENKMTVDEKVATSVSKCIEECEDSRMKSTLANLMSNLSKESQISAIDVESQLEEVIKADCIKEEKGDIDKQISLYQSWGKVRQEALDTELKRLERLRLIDEIEKKKKYLEKREEVLFFFDHKLKLELKRKKIKDETVVDEKAEEEEYMPPELR